MRHADVHELPLPPQADGQEFARIIRLKSGALIFVIDAMLAQKDDPTACWGLVLVDLAHHVANALEGRLRDEQGREVTKQDILACMRQVFDAEWRDRTDEVRRVTDA